MKIRTKTLLVIGITILVLIGVLYINTSNIIRNGFARIEQEAVRQSVDRASEAIWENARSINNQLADWAVWDDSYAFVQNPDPDFVSKNLTENTFTSLELNLVLLINLRGELVYARMYDFLKKQDIPISEELKTHLSQNRVLWQHSQTDSSYKGLILLKENPLLVASRPIVTTEGEGPIAGTIMMGRYLDDNLLAKLSRSQKATLTVFRANDPQLPPDFQIIRNSLVASQQTNYEFTVIGSNPGYESPPVDLSALPVRSIDSNTISSYDLLRDLYGKPALILRLDMYRRVFQQGERSLQFFFAALVVTGLLFGLVNSFLLERLVLSRLADLSKQVRLIATEPERRIRIGGSDELSSFARMINDMLMALEASQVKQRESQERYQKVIEQASEGIFLADAANKRILEVNSALCRLLGYSRFELLNLSVYDIVPYSVDQMNNLAERMRSQKQVGPEEINYRRADGSLVDVEITTTTILTQGREVFCVVVRDITERLAAERERQQVAEALRRSEASLRNIVEQAAVGIAFRTPTGQTIMANQTYCDILGYTKEEMAGLSFLDITHPEDIAISMDYGQQLINGAQDQVTFEKRYLHKNGSTVWGQLSVSAIRDEQGRLQNSIAVLVDITERKLFEQALQEREALLDAIITQAAVGISYTSLDGQVMFANPKLAEITGYRVSELVNMSYRDITHPDDLPVDEYYANLLKTGAVDSCFFEKRYVRKDGLTVWVALNVALVHDDAGQPRYTVTVAQDITDRKTAEQALRERERNLQAIFDQAAVGIAYTALDGKVILINPKVSEIVGYSLEEFRTMNYREYTYPEDNLREDIYMEQLLRGEIEHYSLEKRYVRKDQTIIWANANISLVRDAAGQPSYTVAIIQDINDRKLVEQELRDTQERLQATFDQASVGIAYEKFGNQGLLCNDKYCEILGYSREELLQVDYRERTHPDDLALDEFYTRRLLAGEINSFSIEKRYIRKDRSVVWAYLNLTLTRTPEGEPDYAIIVVQDITDQKKAQEELEESRLRLQATFEQAAVGIAQGGLDGSELLFNQKYCDILGYSAEEIAHMTYIELTHPDDRELDRVKMEQLLAGEIESFSIEKRYIHKQGHPVWVNLNVSLVRDRDGQPRYNIAVVQDISDRKRIEQELQESQARLQATFEQAAVGISQGAFDGRILSCNQRYCNIIGYSPDEINKLNFIDLTHPEDRPRDEIEMEKLLSGQIKSFTLEKRYLHKRNYYVWVNLTVSLVRNADGQAMYTIGIVEDILQRKLVEQQLQESQARLRATFEQAAVGIAHGSFDGKSLDFNQKYCDILGYSPQELRQINYIDITHPDDRQQAQIRREQLMRGEIDKYVAEQRYQHKQGHYVWTSLSVSAIRDPAGRPRYTITVVQDIDDRKRFEAQLTESEERFRSIAQATPIPVLISSLPGGRILYLNKAFAAMMHPSEEQLLGSQTQGLYHNPSDRHQVITALEASGEINNYELQIVRADGSGVWVLLSSKALNFQDQRAALSVFYDITERKQAEQAIRQAEEKYRSIFENATDGIFQTSLTGEMFNANPALARILGYTDPQQMLKLLKDKPSGSYVDPRQRREFMLMMQRDGVVDKFESQMYRYDGTMIWVSEKAHTVYDVDGQPLFYEGTVTDITDRKWAEIQNLLLQQATAEIADCPDLESSLAVVLRRICQLRDWICAEAWLPEAGSLRCSEAWYQRPGAELEHFRQASQATSFSKGSGLPGRVWQSQTYEWLHHINEQPEELFSRKYLLQGQQWDALALPVLTKIGQGSGQEDLIAVLVFFKESAQVEDERIVDVVVAIASQLGSVLARKQAEVALRLAEERYRSIFENASEGIFQTTPDGRFISVNPALANIYGYKAPEEVIHRIANINQQLYVQPQRRQDFLQEIEKYGKVNRFESEVYRKDGSIIWISENARAVSDREGNILYFEGTVVDITARKLAEEKLKQEQAQSERLLLNILPVPIADRLKTQEETIADFFPEATVLFADIVGFTEIAARVEAVELVQMLNTIFSSFDNLTEKHGLEKIKTIGDAYMVVGGLPKHRYDHADAIADMALDMIKAIGQFNVSQGANLSIRVGINTGSVVAGVIGKKKFIYDLWGDTVNVASRMESQGIPGSIQVTETTYQCLKDQYNFRQRGKVEIKGKGQMTTYFLLGRAASLTNNTNNHHSSI